MNLHNDLLKAHIPHDCSQCCRSCPQRTIACIDFYPTNSRIFLDDVMVRLRCETPQSKDKIMKRRFANELIMERSGFYDDGITTLDSYYVQMINDTLSQIRHGKRAYLYTISQIKDVIRYEPHITAKYIPDAGAYEIELEDRL